MWLHMGTFGPKRIVTPDTEHQEAAPYPIVNNEYSLLDVSDVVFIDAPGTGLSRTFGSNKGEAFYGVDADGHAFERFIRRFLSKYDRWNSPKYLFGESYGTPRSAVLAADLRLGRPERHHPALADSQLRQLGGWPDGESRRRSGLCAGAADHGRNRVVPPQAAQPAARAQALPRRSGEVRPRRLHDRAAAGQRTSRRPAPRHRGEAAQLHRPAGRLPAASRSPRGRRRVLEGTEVRRRHHHRAAGLLATKARISILSAQTTSYDPQSNAITSAWNTAINQYLHKRHEVRHARHLPAQRPAGRRVLLEHDPHASGARLWRRRRRSQARSRLAPT